MKVKITPIIISSAFGFLVGAIAPLVAFSDRSETQPAQPPEEVSLPSQKLSQGLLKSHTRLITVKIFSEQSWGSGIIIEREGKVYTVLTNKHVLRDDVNEYQIQTADGAIHKASRDGMKLDNYDLAILNFISAAEYAVATLGDSNSLSEEEKVVAAGFPFGGDKSNDDGFKFTEGQISLILEKSLKNGYQVGYTNQIEKGMSGGPVLNLEGEVVAINGMHAYPLWGQPYIYEDGEQPSPEMVQVMESSSWAIPINKFLQSAPQFATNK